eukprot:1321227-Amphidinium_carterae.1
MEAPPPSSQKFTKKETPKFAMWFGVHVYQGFLQDLPKPSAGIEVREEEVDMVMAEASQCSV